MTKKKQDHGCEDHLGNKYASITDMLAHYKLPLHAYYNRMNHLNWSLERTLTTPASAYAVTDHLGNEYKSVTEMLAHYKLPSHTYYNRMNHLNWTLEKTLTTPASAFETEDHLGNKFKSINAMLRHYGITRLCYDNRLAKGWDLKQILETPMNPASQVSTDHLGNEFPSLISMLQHYGISPMCYRHRKRKKWPLEKILTTPMSDYRNVMAEECEDHLGNKFKSIKDMCDYWHINRTTFFRRRNTPGWDLEKALTAPLQQARSYMRTVTDPDGEVHRNIDAMCAKYGISKTQYLTNIRNNLPMAEALRARTVLTRRCKDHLGNEFRSTNAMCAHYGINKTVLRSRLELGWTLEEILTNPGNNSHYIECVDHEGRKFPTQKAMLKYHGVSYTNFKHRQKLGWDLAKCLAPENTHIVACADHYGNEFDSIQDMLTYWLARTGTYHHGSNRNKPLKECILGAQRIPKLPKNIKVTQVLAVGYYLVQYNKAEYVWTDKTLYEHARRYKLEKHLQKHGDIIANKATSIIVKDRIGGYYDIVLDGIPVMISMDGLFRLAFLSNPKIGEKSATDPVPGNR